VTLADDDQLGRTISEGSDVVDTRLSTYYSVAVVLLNHGQKTTGQKTTKMVFLWSRNLKSPDYVFYFIVYSGWKKWRCCCKITV